VEIALTLLATADRPDLLRENDEAAGMEGEGTERWGRSCGGGIRRERVGGGIRRGRVGDGITCVEI
jgi:hypothetical protein